MTPTMLVKRIRSASDAEQGLMLTPDDVVVLCSELYRLGQLADDMRRVCEFARDESAGLRAQVDLLRTSRDATREHADRVEAEMLSLRAQVAELQALGVSLHKAGDAGYRVGYSAGYIDGQEGEPGRAYLRTSGCIADDLADDIKRGNHRAKRKP